MRRKPKTFALATNQDPPKEFRIFKRGWNITTKGKVLFDRKAAAMVMAEYYRHGVRRQIDLEHLSVDRESKNFDPDSRGSFALEVRNGELWAVDVQWNPDGERRLQEKLQRYVSPFFFYGSKSRRITTLYNVAICGTPATYDAPELVAAIAATRHATGEVIGRLTLSLGVKKMDLKAEIQKMLGLEGDVSDEDLLQALKTALEDEPTETAADEPDGDEGDDKKKEAADDPKDAEMDSALSALPPKVQARLRAKLDRADRLEDRMAKVEKKTEEQEVKELLSANADKFTLKQEKWLLKQSVETVQEFLAHADPVAKPARKEPKRDKEGEGEGEAQGMAASASARKFANMAKVKPEDILAHKKKIQQRERERRGE